jgi:HlyD family secretion protein
MNGNVDERQPPARRRRWLALAAIAGLLVAAAVVAVLRRGPPEDGLLQVNGRVEGDLITLAPKVAGRIAALAVREGDAVRAGQLVARLEDPGAVARLAQAQAAAEALDKQALALEEAITLLRAESATGQAAAQAALAAAEADLRRADAAAQQEERNLDRARNLADMGFVGPQAFESSALAARVGLEQRAAASAALVRSQQALNDAGLGPQRVRARQAEHAALRTQAKAAWARADEARVQVDELCVTAPTKAVVTNRYVNVGEVVAAGTPLFGLVDLSQVHLKVFVPEPLIGRVRLGSPAQIWSDAFPDTPFEAKVGYVASRAEFTPKEIRTVDERVKLVFEVRLHPVADSVGKLMPGQPADGMIRWGGSAPWRRPAR